MKIIRNIESKSVSLEDAIFDSEQTNGSLISIIEVTERLMSVLQKKGFLSDKELTEVLGIDGYKIKGLK